MEVVWCEVKEGPTQGDDSSGQGGNILAKKPWTLRPSFGQKQADTLTNFISEGWYIAEFCALERYLI